MSEINVQSLMIKSIEQNAEAIKQFSDTTAEVARLSSSLESLSSVMEKSTTQQEQRITKLEDRQTKLEIEDGKQLALLQNLVESNKNKKGYVLAVFVAGIGLVGNIIFNLIKSGGS